MPDELERLQINIEADASGTAAGAAQAKQAMAGMRQSVKQSTDGIKRDMRDVAASVKGVASAAAQTAKLGNLELIHKAQIDYAESLRSKIKLLKAEVAREMRKPYADAMSKSVVAAQEKLAKTQLQYAKAAAEVDKTAAKIWAAEDAAANASAVNETASATEKLKARAGGAAEKVREVRKEVERVGRKGPSIMQSIGRSLRSMLIVTAVAGGLRSFLRWMGNVVSADKQVSASLAQVRGNLLTAFAPIYNYIIPAIRTLCNGLATATAWLSSFLGGLFGMSSSAAQDTAQNIAGIGGAAGGASKQVKELLGSFDELNKLDRTESGGGGGGGGGKIEFGDTINSAVGSGSKLQSAFKAAGEAARTFALTLGGLKIAQQVAQWLAPLSGIANANALSMGKWGLAITAAIEYLKSLKHVSEDPRFQIQFSNIIKSDDAWWKKGLKLIGYGCEQLAAAAIHTISQLFGVDGVDIWFTLKDWLYRQVSEWIKWVPGVGPKFIQAFRNLGNNIKTWIDTHVVQPVKNKWNAFVTWVKSLSIAQVFGFGGKQVASVSVDTQPAMTSLGVLDKYLDDIDGRVVTATVNIREGGGGSAGSGGGGRTSTSITNAAKSETLLKDLPLYGALAAVTNKVKNVLGFASGGVGIPRGQLFIANESGAEMVGHIGGKTAVANQQEISGAIWREMQQYKGGSGASADDLANAVARALDGVAIKVGERQLGTLAVHAINKYARQSGRADFAF